MTENIVNTSETKKYFVKIGGMQCSFCVQSIQKVLTKQNGVISASVNLSHEEAVVEYNPELLTPNTIDRVLMSLGYHVRDPEKVSSFEEEQEEIRQSKRDLISAAVITFSTSLLMVLAWVGYGQPWFKWALILLTLFMIFGVGRHILSMAINSLKRSIFNQHVLMEFGAFGGLLGGIVGFYLDDWPIMDFFAGAIFITAYHILSGHVSLVVRSNSSRAIMNLMKLQPDSARVIRPEGEVMVPVGEVFRGEKVKVIPGESIPVDGVVIEGSSSINQSLVTGEAIPKYVTIGDEVIGGSVNQNGSLVIQVTKIGEESFLQQVARSIKEARALKPGVLQLVERVLKYFVPGVLLISLLSFLFWTVGSWLLFGKVFLYRAVLASLTVLVMGYPCALGMATPLAMIRGGGIAASKGILMRSGEAFQVFKDVKIIAFDKTGTITRGEPRVVDTIPTQSTRLLLETAVLVEQFSEHPLASAIVKYGEEEGITPSEEVFDFSSEPGVGVTARTRTGTIFVGNLRSSMDDITDEMKHKIDKLQSNGMTVVGVRRGDVFLGVIAISDTLKDDSKATIDLIKGRGIAPVLITGDSKQTAEYIASKVKIRDVFAETLPQEKAEIIRELQRDGTRVAMVGDGINDAPALMQADVGIAFNAGTDVAIEVADIILVNNDLKGVVDAYNIGKQSYRKTKQNVILAFLFNGIGIPVAATGLITPIFAMIAMVTSVSIVLGNSYLGRFGRERSKE